MACASTADVMDFSPNMNLLIWIIFATPKWHFLLIAINMQNSLKHMAYHRLRARSGHRDFATTSLIYCTDMRLCHYTVLLVPKEFWEM